MALALASSDGSKLDKAGASSDDEASGVREGATSGEVGTIVMETPGFAVVDGESLISGNSGSEGMAASLISTTGVWLTAGSPGFDPGVPGRGTGDFWGGIGVPANDISADDMGVGV